MLEYENGKNRFTHKRQAISDFMSTNESYYVGIERDEEVRKLAENIMKTGVNGMDALHVTCAILAGCDFFITTDDRLLKCHTEKIQIVTPEEFFRRMEVID